jgi:hypothetical protein
VGQPVTVTIDPNQPVACPGRKCKITAVGKPDGGIYTWTSPALLVDSLGNPNYSNDTVYLWEFTKDKGNGKIEERTVPVVVTYYHPKGGVAYASASVLIHKIDFEVTNTAVESGVTAVQEGILGVILGPVGRPTVLTKPKVKIKLDPRCPDRWFCAQNHKVGWLQNLNASARILHYDHTRYDNFELVLPVRDSMDPQEYPFYAKKLVKRFGSQDGLDQQIAEHQDIPTFAAAWEDPRRRVPELRRIVFNDKFTSWLAVLNTDWSQRSTSESSMMESLIFLKHFDWATNVTVDVDWEKEVGSRCTPKEKRPEPYPIILKNGRGTTYPNLMLLGPKLLRVPLVPTVEEFVP